MEGWWGDDDGVELLHDGYGIGRVSISGPYLSLRHSQTGIILFPSVSM